MSKTLNLSTIEEAALVKVLRKHEDQMSGYGGDFKTSRKVALVVVRSILSKLDEEPTEREPS